MFTFLNCSHYYFPLFLHRKLFWTDKGSENVPPKVGSADMDGGNLKNLYTGNLVNIGVLTADITTSKLYWGVSGSGVVRLLQIFLLWSRVSDFH